MASLSSAFVLPPGSVPAPRAGAARPRPRSDELTRPQRQLIVAAIVGLHVVVGWALLQVREVREAVRDAAPMFVNLIAPDKPPEAVIPPPPTTAPPKVVRQPLPVIAAAPTPQPRPVSAFVVAAPVEPSPVPEVVAAVATPPEPTLVQPKVIPPSAVQYLEPISLEYPRLSRKLGEAGRVMLRVFIGQDGLPKQVDLAQSSKFGRLDEAALAAVRKARFRPPTVNGQLVEGWAYVPIDFELEK
jgi:periplasmic protein TonB